MTHTFLRRAVAFSWGVNKIDGKEIIKEIHLKKKRWNKQQNMGTQMDKVFTSHAVYLAMICVCGAVIQCWCATACF